MPSRRHTPRSSWKLICLLSWGLISIGCQQSPNQTGIWPWQTTSPLASNNASQSSGLMNDLLQRQAEQSRLSDVQRRELARLTELYQQQNEKLTSVDREKLRDDRMELARKLQEQTIKVRQQEDELKRLESLRRRSLELDSDNRDLHKQLAQSQQQSRLLEDQLKLMRQQLDDTANQLASAMQAQQAADQQVSALQANLQRNAVLQRRSGAKITANSSARRIVKAVQIAGLSVRQDSDVVRIELPSDQIFMPQTATLKPQAQATLAQVAAAISQHYPRQKIGIEAHTDNAPLQSSQWRSNHQLSAAQAMAVFEQLASSHQFATRQMFVLGHGPNYPISANTSADGQQRNRRIEVVIYPESIDQS